MTTTNTTTNTMSTAQMAARIAELEAKLAGKKARSENQTKTSNGLTLRVSEKGGVSAYGLGKWPVTLYASQWSKLLVSGLEIAEFINAHLDKLSQKAEDKAEDKAASSAAPAENEIPVAA